MKNKYKTILKKIEREKWYLGVRSGDMPLIYSLRCCGEDKYIRKLYSNGFSQWRMLIPKDHGNVRAIGITQAKKFHKLFGKTILKNPQFLIEKILEDEKLLKEAGKKAKNIKNEKELSDVLNLLERHYFLFFLCLSCGMKLFENKSKEKKKNQSGKALKSHDKWRNSVFEKEMKILNNFDVFVRPIAKKNGLCVDDLYYLEIHEFRNCLTKGFKKTLKENIIKRKKKFAYIFINGKSEVIDDETILIFLKNLFKDNPDEKILKGAVAYRNQNKVTGIVQILKNPKLKTKTKKNTILVALQTDPGYIPIVKKFCAIIADEGGITGHAAIISREFKIPCIIGTQNATKILKDGDLVKMDMKKGTIAILKRN